MKLSNSINKCCQTLRIDNVDWQGWRWYNPDNHHDAVVRHFLEGFHAAADKKRHVLRFCHDSITDKQMHAVLQYFKNFRIAFDAGIFGDHNHMEVLKDLYFQSNDGKSRKHKVFFGFDNNNWYNDNRITGIRRMSRNGLTVKKTIFAIDRTIFDWQKNKSIFNYK